MVAANVVRIFEKHAQRGSVKVELPAGLQFGTGTESADGDNRGQDGSEPPVEAAAFPGSG